MEHGKQISTVLVAIEQYPEGPRTTLVFWEKGTERTISVNFMLAGTNPLNSLRIWVESLHRQHNTAYTSPASQIPDIKKLIYVDGLTKKQAEAKVKEVEDSLNLMQHYQDELKKFLKKEFKLWFKVTTVNDKQYYDYVPYAVRTSEDLTSTSALPINTK